MVQQVVLVDNTYPTRPDKVRPSSYGLYLAYLELTKRILPTKTRSRHANQ
jgi:hypothetical protein